jgi:hypothetical protein
MLPLGAASDLTAPRKHIATEEMLCSWWSFLTSHGLRVPDISLVFREMWNTTALNRE